VLRPVNPSSAESSPAGLPPARLPPAGRPARLPEASEVCSASRIAPILSARRQTFSFSSDQSSGRCSSGWPPPWLGGSSESCSTGPSRSCAWASQDCPYRSSNFGRLISGSMELRATWPPSRSMTIPRSRRGLRAAPVPSNILSACSQDSACFNKPGISSSRAHRRTLRSRPNFSACFSQYSRPFRLPSERSSIFIGPGRCHPFSSSISRRVW